MPAPATLLATVIDIDRIRQRAAHLERARELRDSMQGLYESTPEAERDDDFRERVVILWRMLHAEIDAAEALAKDF